MSSSGRARSSFLQYAHTFTHTHTRTSHNREITLLSSIQASDSPASAPTRACTSAECVDSCPFCEFNVSSFANYFSVDCPLFSAHSVQAFCTHTSWPQSRTGGLFLERFEEGGASFLRASTSIHKTSQRNWMSVAQPECRSAAPSVKRRCIAWSSLSPRSSGRH